MKLYIETSVPNFLFADDAPEKRQVTMAFFEWLRICDDELFISKLVEDELRPTPEPKLGKMMAALDQVSLSVLEVPPAASGLADLYLSERIIPARFKNDALHVATAVCHQMDVVVSWNMKHLVNVRKVQRINEVNEQHSFPHIRVHTPEEVMDL
jgi:predicted nucleic acid-binding protein